MFWAFSVCKLKMMEHILGCESKILHIPIIYVSIIACLDQEQSDEAVQIPRIY